MHKTKNTLFEAIAGIQRDRTYLSACQLGRKERKITTVASVNYPSAIFNVNQSLQKKNKKK